MDFIRQQLVTLQERLNGLSGSQKMLAAALVVIMAMTMLYWGKFASNRDMVALSSSAMDANQLSAATAALKARGIEYDESGGVLRVNADAQGEAIGAVTAAAVSATGSTGSNPLDAMLDKLNPLSTQGEFNARLQSVRDGSLKRMMATWPGVRAVDIAITESVKGGLNPTPAGAFVNLATDGSVPARRLANVALAAVLPSVTNLKRENVTITVDGEAIISPANGVNNGFASSEMLEATASVEQARVMEIRKYYSHIPGLKVMVHAELTNERKQEKINSFDKTNAVSLPTESTSEKTTTTDPTPPAEAGAVPNMGLDANAGAVASRGGSKTERTEEKNQNYVGTKETVIETPSGAARILSTTVSVPREFFQKIWKVMNKGAEPTEEQLDTLVNRELTRMKTELMATMQIKDETQVVVTDYTGYEDPAVLVANTAVAAGTGSTISIMAGSHGKEVAIGGLALTSLFMVGRMVKKAAPPAVAPLLALDDMPDISSGGGKKGRKPGTIGGLDIAGEVAEGGSIMMGRELDEEVLETTQMVEQVSGFVKENPDTTAQLLKRWMNRE